MREGWTYKKLGEVCDKSPNINWNKVSEDKQYTYIDLSSVDRECLSVINPQIINKTNAPSRAKQIVETGDVIFATTRPTLRRTCVIGDDYNGQICSTGFCVLRPQKQVLAKWIFYNLQYDGFYSYIEPLQTGANYPAVTDSVVKDYNIPIPPLSEQQSIVAELDKINELISLRKAQLSDLDSLAQSIFYDMFGDPIENEKGWEVKKWKELFDTRLGKMLDKSKQVETDKKYKYLANANVKWGEFDLHSLSEMTFTEKESEEFKLLKGDLLICEGGEAGRCAIWQIDNSDIKFQKAIHRARVKNNIVDTIFVLYYMLFFRKDGGLKDYVTKATIEHLTGVKLNMVPVVLPPLPLQQEFAKRIELIEQQKAQISSTIKDLETLLASRMQYWFD